MKKYLLWILAVMILLFCAGASADTALNDSVFPDAQFLAAVQAFDTDGSGSLSEAEAAAVTRLDLPSRGITSLEGISAFTSLEHLNVTGNDLVTLDVSGCPALVFLACDSNQLESLQLGSKPALKSLTCADNWLSSLDVSGCPALTELYCDSNGLSGLDLSSCPSLVTLFCNGTGLTAFNVKGCPALTTLSCYSCQLVSLDVHSNPALKYLYCSGNQLTSLDLSDNPLLQELICHSNNLTSLILPDNDELETLDCAYNNLSALDLSGCSILKLTVLGTEPVKGDGFSSFQNGKDSLLLADETVTLSTEPAGDMTVTVDGYRYVITGSSAAFAGVTDGSVKKIKIPSSVEVEGKTYKVTSVTANACKGLKKLTTLTIGKNVKKIGRKAFRGCPKLKTVTIHTEKLSGKAVASGAFSDIAENAEITCPAGKADAYRELLLKAGLSETATVK